MQQIFARIRPESKYYYQRDFALEPFPVFIDANALDAYVVRGGPGFQYRLCDVDLLIKTEAGREIVINTTGGEA